MMECVHFRRFDESNATHKLAGFHYAYIWGTHTYDLFTES